MRFQGRTPRPQARRDTSCALSLCAGGTVSKIASMKRHLSSYFALVMLAPILLAAQGPADLVLTNGRIYTVDNARPIVTALAVRGGRVVFVGSDAEAKVLASP